MNNKYQINFKIFDSDPQLLAVSDIRSSYPLWLSVRFTFLRWLSGELFYDEPVTPQTNFFRTLNTFVARREDTLITNINNNKKIIIWTTGLGNYASDGSISDRLVQKFANTYSQETFILQPRNLSMEQLPFNFKETYCTRNIGSFDNLNVKIAAFWGKERHIGLNNLTTRFSELVKLYHDIELNVDQAKTLKIRALQILSQNHKLQTSFTAFFQKNQGIKLLMLEEGYYGGVRIPFIIAAKNAGVHVAEFQHGAIAPGHEAYNVGFDRSNQSIYSAVGPDTFLSYGNWWRSQMRLPNKIIDIGNPQRDTFPVRSENQNDSKQILVLGDGLETQKYVSLALEINKVVEHKVIFRPHPLERHKFLEDRADVSVEIDLSSELSSRLANTDVIISELSTGLFDALGIVEHIYIWKTTKSEAAFGTLPFASFESVEELREKLSNAALKPPTLPCSTDVWKENWINNYKNFVDPIIR